MNFGVCQLKEDGGASGASTSYIMMEEGDGDNAPSYLGSRLATFQMTLARQVDLDPDGVAGNSIAHLFTFFFDSICSCLKLLSV